jgi:hypothetical protein
MKPSRQSGNAMLFVLIGIVLFAALSYSFTRSNRASTLSLEDARIAANSILSYAEKINNAVQLVKLQNGCLNSQISFENATVAGYTNANAPASKKCHIFDSAGGTMLYEAPPSSALDSAAAAASSFADSTALLGSHFFFGGSCVDNIGTGPHATCATDGVDNEELLLILPWVNAGVCDAINTILGNSAAMLQDPAGGFQANKFTGSFSDGLAIGAAGYTAYANACFRSTSAAVRPGIGYHFYYTLAAR